ncbi:MAG: hypothetical protein QXI36_02090 [Candidatus Bathyarchaeia archaeon]
MSDKNDNTLGIIGLVMLGILGFSAILFIATRTTVVTVERTDKGYVIIEKRV